MKCVGIDIGTYSVKMAEIETSGGSSFHLTHFEEFPLPHAPGADASVDIVEILRKISERYDHSQTKFVLGIRQEHTSVRRRQFPFRERQKILKSLPFDLEDEMPFDQDDVVVDAKLQHFVGPLTQVLAVACPKSQIERVLSLCKDGLIDPDVVTTEGFAFADAVEGWRSLPRDSSTASALSETSRRTGRILLHIGHSRTLIAVYDEQEMLSVRTLFWGGRNIIEAISKRFEVPYGEAVQALINKGFVLLNKEGASKDQIVFSDTIAGACDPLFQNLNLTMLSLESNENLSIEEIQITGLVAKIRNFNAFITQILERRANTFDPLSRIGQLRFALTPDVAATAVIAFGLAAAALPRPRNPAINLRRAELGKTSDIVQRQWKKWRQTLLVVGLAYVAFFAYAMLRLSFTEDLNSTAEQTLATMGQQSNGLNSKKRSEIQRFIKNRQKQMRNKGLVEKLQNITSPLELINEISRGVPTKERIRLDISELIVRDNFLHMKGAVGDQSELKLLEAALKNISTKGKGPETLAAPQVKTGVPFAYRIEVTRLSSKED